MSNLGISAVLQPGPSPDSAILDLAAVLQGLVGDRFEIILVMPDTQLESELRPRAPGLPLRTLPGTIREGCAAARFELLLVSARDGQFDVRELNHLLEAIERGADVAVGYRPRPTDVLVRGLQRWGWKLEVDCAFVLARHCVWEHLRGASWGEARRMGYRVCEVPVRHQRPSLGAAVAA